MIMRFLDWSHDQEQPFGILCFVLVSTFACLTGLALIILLIDVLSEGE